jgi:hypothetical protein
MGFSPICRRILLMKMSFSSRSVASSGSGQRRDQRLSHEFVACDKSGDISMSRLKEGGRLMGR